jgi:hypothetical protein
MINMIKFCKAKNIPPILSIDVKRLLHNQMGQTPSWLRHSVSVPDLLSNIIFNNPKLRKNIGFAIASIIHHS